MTKPKRCALRLLLALFPVASSTAFAIKVTTSPDFDLDTQVLLQPRLQLDFDGVAPAPTSTAPDGPAPNGKMNVDMFIKRARLVGRGSAYKYFEFLVTLDTPQFGVRGNYGFVQSNATFIQDLVATFAISPELKIDFGFLLIPFSHGSVSTPQTQSAIDASGTLVSARFYNNAARASREAGLQLRTLLFDHRILLRAGIYEGARSSQAGELATCGPGQSPPACLAPGTPVVNPGGKPMLAGLLRYNFLGDEVTFPGFAGIYLDGKTRVSVGVGGQWQDKGAVGGLRPGATAYPDYLALAADVFADVALPDDMEAVFQLNGYRSDYGGGNSRTGWGLASELGFRWHAIEPQTSVAWFNSDNKNASLLRWAGGVNYFFKRHAAKLSGEFVHVVSGNLSRTPSLHQIVIQAQFWF